MDSVETIVIGGGAVGLAIGRQMARRGDCLVLEAETQFGQGVSSRNSEVIHAGIYYPSDSLKAKLCVRGKALLYNYCETRGVPHRKCGKLIVATSTEEEPQLANLASKAEQNGVEDLVWLSERETKALEHQLQATAALLSPSTGIVSAHEYMLSMVADIESSGGLLSVGSRVTGAQRCEGGYTLKIATLDDERFEVGARLVINAAGLNSQAVAACLQDYPVDQIPKRYLCRGHYFSLKGPQPFSRLIYPVPPASGAGLGIHATIDLAGQVKFGPDVEYVEAESYEVNSALDLAFFESISRYFPGIRRDALVPAYAGIRPKTQAPGQAPTDFEIRHENALGFEGWVNLFGIESPGLTSSLAIAEYVEELLD
jgi:L-2-hydroxyglutarate oxidase LhgO